MSHVPFSHLVSQQAATSQPQQAQQQQHHHSQQQHNSSTPASAAAASPAHQRFPVNPEYYVKAFPVPQHFHKPGYVALRLSSYNPHIVKLIKDLSIVFRDFDNETKTWFVHETKLEWLRNHLRSGGFQMVGMQNHAAAGTSSQQRTQPPPPAAAAGTPSSRVSQQQQQQQPGTNASPAAAPSPHQQQQQQQGVNAAPIPCSFCVRSTTTGRTAEITAKAVPEDLHKPGYIALRFDCIEDINAVVRQLPGREFVPYPHKLWLIREQQLERFIANLQDSGWKQLGMQYNASPPAAAAAAAAAGYGSQQRTSIYGLGAGTSAAAAGSGACMPQQHTAQRQQRGSSSRRRQQRRRDAGAAAAADDADDDNERIVKSIALGDADTDADADDEAEEGEEDDEDEDEIIDDRPLQEIEQEGRDRLAAEPAEEILSDEGHDDQDGDDQDQDGSGGGSGSSSDEGEDEDDDHAETSSSQSAADDDDHKDHDNTLTKQQKKQVTRLWRRTDIETRFMFYLKHVVLTKCLDNNAAADDDPEQTEVSVDPSNAFLWQLSADYILDAMREAQRQALPSTLISAHPRLVKSIVQLPNLEIKRCPPLCDELRCGLCYRARSGSCGGVQRFVFSGEPVECNGVPSALTAPAGNKSTPRKGDRATSTARRNEIIGNHQYGGSIDDTGSSTTDGEEASWTPQVWRTLLPYAIYGSQKARRARRRARKLGQPPPDWVLWGQVPPEYRASRDADLAPAQRRRGTASVRKRTQPRSRAAAADDSPDDSDYQPQASDAGGSQAPEDDQEQQQQQQQRARKRKQQQPDDEQQQQGRKKQRLRQGGKAAAAAAAAAAPESSDDGWDSDKPRSSRAKKSEASKQQQRGSKKQKSSRRAAAAAADDEEAAADSQEEQCESDGLGSFVVSDNRVEYMSDDAKKSASSESNSNAEDEGSSSSSSSGDSPKPRIARRNKAKTAAAAAAAAAVDFVTPETGGSLRRSTRIRDRYQQQQQEQQRALASIRRTLKFSEADGEDHHQDHQAVHHEDARDHDHDDDHQVDDHDLDASTKKEKLGPIVIPSSSSEGDSTDRQKLAARSAEQNQQQRSQQRRRQRRLRRQQQQQGDGSRSPSQPAAAAADVVDLTDDPVPFTHPAAAAAGGPSRRRRTLHSPVTDLNSQQQQQQQQQQQEEEDGVSLKDDDVAELQPANVRRSSHRRAGNRSIPDDDDEEEGQADPGAAAAAAAVSGDDQQQRRSSSAAAEEEAADEDAGRRTFRSRGFLIGRGMCSPRCRLLHLLQHWHLRVAEQLQGLYDAAVAAQHGQQPMHEDGADDELIDAVVDEGSYLYQQAFQDLQKLCSDLARISTGTLRETPKGRQILEALDAVEEVLLGSSLDPFHP